MIATAIEFLVSLYIYIKHKDVSVARNITLVITEAITVLILIIIFYSYIS